MVRIARRNRCRVRPSIEPYRDVFASQARQRTLALSDKRKDRGIVIGHGSHAVVGGGMVENSSAPRLEFEYNVEGVDDTLGSGVSNARVRRSAAAEPTGM